MVSGVWFCLANEEGEERDGILMKSDDPSPSIVPAIRPFESYREKALDVVDRNHLIYCYYVRHALQMHDNFVPTNSISLYIVLRILRS